MSRPQLGHQIRRIVTRIVSQNGRNLAQRVGESFYRDRLLALDFPGLFFDSTAHEHLRATAAEDDPSLFDGLGEHGERVVQGAVGFVDHLGGRAAQDDGAGLAGRDAGEFDELCRSFC